MDGIAPLSKKTIGKILEILNQIHDETSLMKYSKNINIKVDF